MCHSRIRSLEVIHEFEPRLTRAALPGPIAPVGDLAGDLAGDSLADPCQVHEVY